LYSAKGVASIIGSWVGAIVYEHTGSWAGGFYGSAVMALVAAGLSIVLAATASRRTAASVVVAEAK
jgi:predicted MFS family arabinose efflux permease